MISPFSTKRSKALITSFGETSQPNSLLISGSFFPRRIVSIGNNLITTSSIEFKDVLILDFNSSNGSETFGAFENVVLKRTGYVLFKIADETKQLPEAKSGSVST